MALTSDKSFLVFNWQGPSNMAFSCKVCKITVKVKVGLIFTGVLLNLVIECLKIKQDRCWHSEVWIYGK